MLDLLHMHYKCKAGTHVTFSSVHMWICEFYVLCVCMCVYVYDMWVYVGVGMYLRCAHIVCWVLCVYVHARECVYGVCVLSVQFVYAYIYMCMCVQ